MKTTINITLTVDELRGIVSEEITKALAALVREHSEQSDQPELMKIQEVADLFKVSKVTIFEWKKQGKIPFHRIARKIFFKRSEVMESLKHIKANYQKNKSI